MKNQIVTINGIRFTISEESTGISIILQKENTNEKFGEVFVESYKEKQTVNIYSGNSSEPKIVEFEK